MENTKTLPEEEIIRAATNDPALATVTFTLGDREFPIVDLKYRDYIEFVVLMKPLLSVVVGGIAGAKGVDLGPAFDPSQLITYLSENLPEMVRLICAQTDPDVTTEWVMEKGGNPFRLAKIVLYQINRNKIIGDFADFFALIIPIVQQGKTALNLGKTLETTH